MSNLSRFADQARSRGVSLGPRGNDFVRACFALAASNAPGDAERFAAARWGASSRAANITKAAVAAAATNNPTSSPLVSEGGAVEFFAAVQERSILGRMTGLRRVPFYIKTIAATGATAYWAGEGQAKPLSAMAFSSSALPVRKVMGLAVATKEMLASSDPAAEGMFRQELMAAVVAALDEAFIDPTNAGVADVTPAAVTNGLSAVTGTSSFAADLKSMLSSFTGDLAASYLVMGPALAVGLSGAAYPRLGARGGEAAGIPVLTSRHVPSGVVGLIDPAGIAVGEGAAEVRTLREGDVLMADDPAMASAALGSPSAPVAAQLVSLWATNSVAILVGRHVNWQAVRAGSVSLITSASYGDAA